jgi:hypothetical protein
MANKNEVSPYAKGEKVIWKRRLGIMVGSFVKVEGDRALIMMGGDDPYLVPLDEVIKHSHKIESELRQPPFRV